MHKVTRTQNKKPEKMCDMMTMSDQTNNKYYYGNEYGMQRLAFY